MKNINELSVVLPTLNEAENLKVLIPDIANSLESIQIDNYEIIVVDDGSTDTSPQILAKLKLNCEKLKIFTTKHPNKTALSTFTFFIIIVSPIFSRFYFIFVSVLLN